MLDFPKINNINGIKRTWNVQCQIFQRGLKYSEKEKLLTSLILIPLIWTKSRIWTQTLTVCECVSLSIEWLILCVCMYMCICVFQCQEQGQLQECVSAVRVCLARLDYVIKVHTTTQPPPPRTPTYPSLFLSFSVSYCVSFFFCIFLSVIISFYLAFDLSFCISFILFLFLFSLWLLIFSLSLSRFTIFSWFPLDFYSSSYLILPPPCLLKSSHPLSSSLVPHLSFAKLVLAY